MADCRSEAHRHFPKNISDGLLAVFISCKLRISLKSDLEGGGTDAIWDLLQRHMTHGLEHYIDISRVFRVGSGLVGVRLDR